MVNQGKLKGKFAVVAICPSRMAGELFFAKPVKQFCLARVTFLERMVSAVA